MNPPRVVEQYPRSLEAQLLRAGRAVSAPDSTLKLTLGALGLYASATAATSVSGAAYTKAWSLFGTMTAKWTAVAILVASGTFVAARLPHWLRAAASAPEQPQRTRAAATVTKADTPPAALVTETSELQAAPSRSDSKATPRLAPHERPPAAKSGESLGAEVTLIDAVRQAVDEGRAARALGLLQQHDLQFKKPRLAQEATLLRTRALEQLARGSEPRE
jgi:hypothetical protein